MKETSGQGWSTNTALRFGLTPLFEINSVLEYKTETTHANDITTKTNGLSVAAVGMRYHLYTSRGWIPNLGVLVRFKIPRSGGDYSTKYLAPRILFVASQSITKRLKLSTQFGIYWNGNDKHPIGNYVINLSTPIGKKLSAFVENVGDIQQGVLVSSIDTGISWLLRKDLQLDLYGGHGNNDGVKDYFVSMGIHWRTKSLRR